jgi:hypothetical protein
MQSSEPLYEKKKTHGIMLSMCYIIFMCVWGCYLEADRVRDNALNFFFWAVFDILTDFSIFRSFLN